MLFDEDFYAWSYMQAVLIRDGRFDELDYENLVEELESLGRSVKSNLEFHLEALLILFLKWLYIPNRQCYGWRMDIKLQRMKAAQILEDNISLSSKIPDCLASAYKFARIGAIRETGLLDNTFPVQCPWTFEQMVDDGFFPD